MLSSKGNTYNSAPQWAQNPEWVTGPELFMNPATPDSQRSPFLLTVPWIISLC